MAAGVLIKPGAVGQKRVGGPAIGNESLEDIAQDFFNGQVDAAVGREGEPIFALQAEYPFHHTSVSREVLLGEYTPNGDCSTWSGWKRGGEC